MTHHLAHVQSFEYHTLPYQTTRDTAVLTCLQQPPFNNKHLSIIQPEAQLYLPAYSNHLTITTTYLPYYQTQLNLPAYSNHLTITTTYLPYYQTQLNLPAYSNHLTITTTYLPYYQTQLNLPAYSNHLTILQITTKCLPYYQRYNN